MQQISELLVKMLFCPELFALGSIKSTGQLIYYCGAHTGINTRMTIRTINYQPMTKTKLISPQSHSTLQATLTPDTCALVICSQMNILLFSPIPQYFIIGLIRSSFNLKPLCPLPSLSCCKRRRILILKHSCELGAVGDIPQGIRLMRARESSSLTMASWPQ